MALTDLQTWELWYPAAAATGLEFARGRIDPTEVLWVVGRVQQPALNRQSV